MNDFQVNELMKKFPPEMQELIHTNAFAKSVFNSLLYGASPYSVIVTLLKSNQEALRIIQGMIDRLPPNPIVLTENEFQEYLKMKSGEFNTKEKE